MKKWMALALAAAVCLSLLACGGPGSADAPEKNSNDQTLLLAKLSVRQFLTERGYPMQEAYARTIGQEPQPLTLKQGMEYRLKDWDGFPVHCLLFRFDGEVAFGNCAADKIFLLVDLETGTLYDSTQLDDAFWASFTGTCTEAGQVPLACLNAYDCYTAGYNDIFGPETETAKPFTEEELASLMEGVPVPADSSFSPQSPAPVFSADSGPEEDWEPLPSILEDTPWNERSLSDEALIELRSAPAQEIRAAIATVADARAFLDLRFFSLWMDASCLYPETDIAVNTAPQDLLNDPQSIAGRSDISNLLMYLVEDDLPVGIIYAPIVDLDETIGPNAAANYIRTENGYIIFDPVLGMQGDRESNFMDRNLLPEAQTASLEEYAALAGAANDRVWKLYAWEGSGEISRIQSNTLRKLEFLSPEVAPLYHNPELDSIKTYADPENIHAYGLSRKLGGLTLTPAEARELVDAAPEVVKEKVRTAADLLLYMLAANITDCYGCFCVEAGGQVWHYNLNAYQVMSRKVGNCGSSANLANYLLEGDYEEVGIILHAYYPGNGGGHVYNYILHEGKYYIVDYSSYIFSLYNPQNDFPVMELNSLEEYGKRFQEIYGGVCLVLAHTTPGQHYPNIFDDANRRYVIPDDGEFTVLFQSEDPSAYQVATAPVPSVIPDWHSVGQPD